MEQEEKELRKAENQKKIAYLRKYKHAKIQEQQILDEIQRLREDEMFPSYVMNGMPRGSWHSDLSEYAARLDEEMEKLGKQKLECIKIYSDISSRIRRVKDDNQKELLNYRYIKCMEWEEIAAAMSFSWSHMHRIHGKALENIEIPKDGIE